MTPMIDVTFQLIIFFMLTTQMASQEIVTMKVPAPPWSVAKELGKNRAIVNVVPYSDKEIRQDETKMGLAKWFQIKSTRIPLGARSERELVDLLRKMKADSGDATEAFAVELRADQRIHYSQIQPVLRALQTAQMEKMRITALVGGRNE